MRWCWMVGPVSLPSAFQDFPNSGREREDCPCPHPCPPRHHQSVLAAVQLLRYITHRQGEAEEKKLQSPLTWNFSSISYNSCKSWVNDTSCGKMSFFWLKTKMTGPDFLSTFFSQLFSLPPFFLVTKWKWYLSFADKLQTKHGEKMLTPSW